MTGKEEKKMNWRLNLEDIIIMLISFVLINLIWFVFGFWVSSTPICSFIGVVIGQYYSKYARYKESLE